MRNGLRAILQITAALAASFAAQGDALRPGLVATYRDAALTVRMVVPTPSFFL